MQAYALRLDETKETVVNMLQRLTDEFILLLDANLSTGAYDGIPYRCPHERTRSSKGKPDVP